MNNDVLNSLLKEFSQKKLKAELELDRRKDKLYKSIPKLQEIEDDLNTFAIAKTKSILTNSNTDLSDLKNKIELLKYQKAKILSENNIEYKYLEPYYDCKICNDTGYITSSNYTSSMCSCLKQRMLDISFNKSNIYNLDKENFTTFNPNIFSSEVDVAKYRFNISPRENISNIQKKCMAFTENFDNKNTKNLLFSGNTGLGKTFMTNCIANELIKKGKTVLYQTAPVLIDSIIDYKMAKNKNYNENILKSALEVDLLIIDDLGTESLNSMKLSELFTIINTRILNLNNKSTKTIISTNLNIKDIFRNYEERIGSRIAGYYDLYYFFGNDLRFKTK